MGHKMVIATFGTPPQVATMSFCSSGRVAQHDMSTRVATVACGVGGEPGGGGGIGLRWG
jgi:hypothetical protein